MKDKKQEKRTVEIRSSTNDWEFIYFLIKTVRPIPRLNSGDFPRNYQKGCEDNEK